MKPNKKPAKLKKIKSINFSLWLNFSLFSVIIIVLVTLIVNFLVAGIFAEQLRSRLYAIGNKTINALEEINASNAYLINDYIKDIELSENADIYVFSAQGSVILPFEAQVENGKDLVEQIKQKLQTVDSDDALIYSSNNSINFVKSLNGESYLIISLSTAFINSAIRLTQRYLILIAFIALLIAFIISYSLAQKFSEPLNSISKTSMELAKGNYEVNFTSTEYREFAQLSDTLNYAKDEIKKSGDFQKELLANVSHDFKTPLTMIKAYASMIKEISGDDPEKREKHLQVIIDETDRLTGLVDDVLNVSKITTNIDKINKKVFNLTEFLYSIISKFDYLRETQGYTFMVDITPDLYTLADAEKIGQAIYNLLSNAVNYTGEDKTVYITLKADSISGRIKFSVRDTGKGIKKDDLLEIWDRYYRVKEAHLRPVQGTGLGLNIVKTILDKHSFDFGVTSEVGKGSTFWIDFPEISPNIKTQ
ncbi:MAG: HAMP domain-containing histidine kinase [Clostridiales bacterium]|nr:HAMP domain-containing histidine kinase [Clostridiales bacterium]